MITESGDDVRDNFYSFHRDAFDASDSWRAKQPRE